MIGRIHRFFVRRETSTVERRPMTPEEIAAFDAAFGKMGEAFNELGKLFKKDRP